MRIRSYGLLFALLAASLPSAARLLPKPRFSGMYLQWGYNRDLYSRSDLHFVKSGEYDFTIHDARAVDQPDFAGFWETPIDITIPQNSYRIGVYLNRTRTWAVELNFDHAKYVVHDDQHLRVSGHIHGERIDADTIIRRQFVHLEHTNGANFYHINYVHQRFLLEGTNRPLLSYLLKAGAGVVVPRSDVTLFGKRIDNDYHIAGYIASAEAGMRYYPLRNFFVELNVKGGFANFTNVLSGSGGRVYHHFWYGELIALAGYDLSFGRHREKPTPVLSEFVSPGNALPERSGS